MENRNFKSGASASPPTAPITPSNGYPTEGNPATATPATLPGAFWFHKIGEELRAVITGFGLTPSDTALNQVYLAIQAGIAANIQPSAAISGAVSGFTASAIGINNYNCTVAGKEAVLENGSNLYMTVRAFSKTINANGTVGAPLSIMSARAGSTWYYRWLWYNVANGLTATLDISSTAPTAPTGFVSTDYKALLPGACLTDSSGSKYLMQIITIGTSSQFAVLTGSNTATLPVLASGTSAGNISTPTYVAASWGNFAPPATKMLKINAFLVGAGGAGQLIIAPNSSYSNVMSLTNPPPINISSLYQTGVFGTIFDIMPETPNIYWAASSASWASISMLGWSE